jgi:hypothetical protein
MLLQRNYLVLTINCERFAFFILSWHVVGSSVILGAASRLG